VSTGRVQGISTEAKCRECHRLLVMPLLVIPGLLDRLLFMPLLVIPLAFTRTPPLSTLSHALSFQSHSQQVAGDILVDIIAYPLLTCVVTPKGLHLATVRLIYAAQPDVLQEVPGS